MSITFNEQLQLTRISYAYQKVDLDAYGISNSQLLAQVVSHIKMFLFILDSPKNLAR